MNRTATSLVAMAVLVTAGCAAAPSSNVTQAPPLTAAPLTLDNETTTTAPPDLTTQFPKSFKVWSYCEDRREDAEQLATYQPFWLKDYERDLDSPSYLKFLSFLNKVKKVPAQNIQEGEKVTKSFTVTRKKAP